ncbi:hypothetical protein SSS_05876 [Sarcoptes scabiei]|nr:hypothetical protein SSS_05876 [Sarcoptes scabiei]
MSKKPNENHGIKLSLDLLKNKTIYWPLTFEHSALLKLKNSSKFLSLIAQKHLDEIESKEIIEMIQYFLRANSSRENGSLFNRRNDSKEIKSIICKEIRHALVSYNFNSEHQRILDYYDNLIRKTIHSGHLVIGNDDQHINTSEVATITNEINSNRYVVEPLINRMNKKKRKMEFEGRAFQKAVLYAELNEDSR